MGGDISIHATDVTVDGSYFGNKFIDISAIACESISIGKAGNINIETDRLTVTKGGVITATTYGRGDGGDITIHGNDVTVDGAFENNRYLYWSGIACGSGSNATGKAGGVNIETDTLVVINGGGISTSSQGKGDSGDITIRATDVTVDGAFNGSNSVYRSSIDCNGVDGKAGNINIETDRLTVTNGGGITATTYGRGDGGDITIHGVDYNDILIRF